MSEDDNFDKMIAETMDVTPEVGWLEMYQAYEEDVLRGKRADGTELPPEIIQAAKEHMRECRVKLARYLKIPYVRTADAAVAWARNHGRK